MTNVAIEVVIHDALTAFWEAVVRHYPQAVTGDLSPLATMQLSVSAENAIEEWIDNNVRSSDADTASSGGDHE
jgi:hypothetical protein